MYSKKESSLLKEQFWTALGMYMAPILSAEGEKINWVNYKTGQKNLRFIMQADEHAAYIGLELSHKNQEDQKEIFAKLLQFKKAFTQILNEEWQWERCVVLNDEQLISRIFTEMKDVSIFNTNDWPELISFFKQRIIALDRFWSEYKFALE